MLNSSMHLWKTLALLMSLSSDIYAYVLPKNKIGINDQAFVNAANLDVRTLEIRNDKLQTDIDPAVHQYNVYWESFESSGVQPSTSPLNCPTGYVQYPPTAAGLKTGGGRYNHYHCYLEAVIEIFQNFLTSDFDHGWQSSAVIWCAPVIFRDPACLGMPSAAVEAGPKNYSETYANYVQINSGTTAQIESYHYSPTADNNLAPNATQAGPALESAFDSLGCSCVPTDASMLDFADYATFLGYDLMAGMPGGFLHYIVFNEAASSEWTDLSPVIDVTKPLTPNDQQIWINKYAAMMQAVSNNVPQPALIYASTDRWFGVPPTLTQWNTGRVHLGTQNLLIGLWNTLGVATNWSVAVHAYGNVYAREFNFENGIVNAYGPSTIGDVAAFQLQQLKRVSPGSSTDYTKTPQLILASTEQGWPSSNAEYTPPVQAEIICQTFQLLSDVPSLIYIANNDFQNDGSDPYGLVPNSVDATLDNAATSLAYQAYVATNPTNWNKNAQNYCCKMNSTLGCPS